MKKEKRYNRSRNEVMRERCRIEGPLPVAYREPVPIGGIVEKIMGKLGLEGQSWFTELEAEWGNIVGKAVASHSRPGSVKNGELVVFVDSSVWLSELARYGRGQLLKNLSDRFGKSRIRSVRLQLDPGS